MPTEVPNLRSRFGLTLMVNHACNLRCTYCYTGAKFNAPMPRETGIAAIDCALRSLAPGGRLDLGFFGGEPLIEAERVLEWMDYARAAAREGEKTIRFNLTTNGTVTSASAWQAMMAGDLELAVSFDAAPGIHDRHRRDTHGRPTSHIVSATLRRLLDEGRDLRVVVVVRPDCLEDLPDGLRFLHGLGVRRVELSLDLWTKWTVGDACRLQAFVERAARLWRQWLPHFHVNWFETKTADLAGLPASEETTCCGFGAGEIAVAPSGRLYPCERVIGEDRPDHPLRLPGNVLKETDFLGQGPAPFERCTPCSACALSDACDTTCRCSNFIRTGDVNRPDGLLCLLNKATAIAVAAVLDEPGPTGSTIQPQNERQIHVS